MFEEIIHPRFVETDALKHINNTVYPQWFEMTRTPIFRLFTPDLDANKWQLTLAHISCDFHNEVFYGLPVTIKTAIVKVGNSSIHVTQAAYQNDRLCCTGKSIIVHFNHQEKASMPIPDDIREQLNQHLLVGDWPKAL